MRLACTRSHSLHPRLERRQPRLGLRQPRDHWPQVNRDHPANCVDRHLLDGAIRRGDEALELALLAGVGHFLAAQDGFGFGLGEISQRRAPCLFARLVGLIGSFARFGIPMAM